MSARAIVTGVVILLAGTIPRNIAFALNLRLFTTVPWAVPVVGVYLWFFWRYLRGDGPPATTAHERRTALRANPLPGQVWIWSLVTGGVGLAALVAALRVLNRLVALPPQTAPDLSAVSSWTVMSLLLAAAPIAGVIEEAAFRGYMQRPLERQYGLPIALLITGTFFALVHLDFTPVLWPYYVAVAAIYGSVSYATDSILPAIVLHTAGNTFSNMDLWLHGEAEWQAPASAAASVWQSGADTAFWLGLAAALTLTVATVVAYARLRRAVARHRAPGDTAFQIA